MTFAWLGAHQGEFSQRPLFQYPFIRLLWLGETIVSIFFVISDYVLSYKFFEQSIINQDRNLALRTLGSSIIRRGPRLFIPTLVMVTAVAIFSYIGLFEISRYHLSTELSRSMSEGAPPRGQTIMEQLRNVQGAAISLMTLWSKDLKARTEFNIHSWTIHAEMTISMVLFLAMFVSHRLHPNSMMLFFGIIALVASINQQFFFATFFAGACTACWEVQHRSVVSMPIASDKIQPEQEFVFTHRTGLFVAVLGAFLASAPAGDAHKDVFYRHVYAWFPLPATGDAVYLRTIGCILIVWATLYWKPLNNLFSQPFCAYLGKISFRWYLCHGPILRLVFHAVLPIFYQMYSVDGKQRPEGTGVRTAAWFAGTITCLPITLYVADWFWRCVDIPTVRLCSKLKVNA